MSVLLTPPVITAAIDVISYFRDDVFIGTMPIISGGIDTTAQTGIQLNFNVTDGTQDALIQVTGIVVFLETHGTIIHIIESGGVESAADGGIALEFGISDPDTDAQFSVEGSLGTVESVI